MNTRQRYNYKITDDRFGRLALTLREKASLTQQEIATALGVSERTIRYWEDGTTFPTSTNLKQLVALFLRSGAFVAGREREEARALWSQADASAVRRKSLFDESWFDTMFSLVSNAEHPVPSKESEDYHETPINGHPVPERSDQIDWGDAPDIRPVYGREQELATLGQWIGVDQARVVALLGMGGIGKTTLALRVSQSLAPQFERIVWRSLRDAPPPEEFVTELLHTLAAMPSTSVASRVESTISALVQLLQQKRCLLVLDNADAVLEPGSMAGHYRVGYEGYPLLFKRIAETAHGSCLVLTSREMPSELEPFLGARSPVRSLRLSGLARPATQEMLFDKDLIGTSGAWDRFIEHYAGNPLALKIAAATVHTLFGGDLGMFVEQGPIPLYTLQQLLDDHLERLSVLERDVLAWLAIERDPVSLDGLSANFIFTLPRRDLLAALNSLQRRSLVERGEHGASFTLQPVIMEHVSDRLVRQFHESVAEEQLEFMARYALMKSESKDYIRESQIRMIVRPLIDRLVSSYGDSKALERQLIELLASLREQPQEVQGYAGGNLVNLLVCLSGHLRHVDLSRLVLRQAFLAGIDAQGANLIRADIHETRFTEPIETIASMMLSPDGQFMAVGSFSGQIRVWRVENMSPLWSNRGHPRLAWALAYSPDGKLLASGGYDGKVQLWEAATGRGLAVYESSPTPVRSLAFSPKEQILASAGDDGTIRLWDIQQGSYLQEWHGHRGPVWSLAFDPTGELLVTGGLDGTARVWDVDTRSCVRVLQQHSSGIFAVAFQPNSPIVACGTEDGQISVWNARSGESVATMHRTAKGLAVLAYNPEGTLLASGGNQGIVELWGITEGADNKYRSLVHIMHDHSAMVSTVAFGPGDLLASVSRGGKVRLWDAQSGKMLRTIQGYSRLITALSFSPDGTLLAQGSDNGVLRVWDVNSGRCLNTWDAHHGPVWSIAWHPDGKFFGSGGDGGEVKLWPARGGLCLRTLEGGLTVIWALCFSPDGTRLAGAGVDKVIKLWRVGSGREDSPAEALEGSSDQIISLAFSADGQLLASGQRDGELRLWEWKNGSVLRSIERGPGSVDAVQFVDDGKTLISYSSNSHNDPLEWWEVTTGRCLKRNGANGSGNWLKGAAFSLDGAILATAGDDQTVKVLKVEEQGGQIEFANFAGHPGQVWSLALSMDHHVLASGDDAGNVILWDTHTGEKLRCLRAERPYEQMNIHGITGITGVQHDALKALGAIENGQVPEGSESADW